MCVEVVFKIWNIKVKVKFTFMFREGRVAARPFFEVWLVRQKYKKMDTQEKSGWGGRREGAGKPKTHGKRYGFAALPEVEAILESHEGNKSDFINAAILYYAEHLGK